MKKLKPINGKKRTMWYYILAAVGAVVLIGGYIWKFKPQLIKSVTTWTETTPVVSESVPKNILVPENGNEFATMAKRAKSGCGC